MSDSALGNTPPATPPGNTPPAEGNAPPATPPGVSFPDNWKDGIGEEWRKDPSMEAIKSVDDLAKSYVHSQKMIGKDKVIVPDPKFATDKDWAAFFQKAGLPADVKDYKIDAPKDAQLDDAFLGDFKATAHKLNVLPAQAQKLLEWYLAKEDQMSKDTQTKVANEIVAGLSAYKEKCGAAFEKKTMFANKTLQEFGGPDVMKLFASNPGLGNNPLLIETLAKIGEKLFSEDSFQGDSRMTGAMTPDEARAKRNEIMGDPKHPYWVQGHPGHQEAVSYVNKLFEYENPQ